MRNEKKIFTTMPCPFDSSLAITEDMWSISIVQKKGEKYELKNEHANLVLISLFCGELNAIKLHITGSGNRMPKSLKELVCGTNTYLHVQIVDNKERGIVIHDDLSLEEAVKAVLNMRSNKDEQFKSLRDELSFKTWEITRKQGLALVTDVARQEAVCHQTKPPFSILGHESLLNRGYSRLAMACAFTSVLPVTIIEGLKQNPKECPIQFGTSLVMGSALLYAGGVVMSAKFIPSLLSASSLLHIQYAYKTSAKLISFVANYSISAGVYGFIGTEEEDMGHSCFTWAREILVEHIGERVRNDPCFVIQDLDNLVVITTRHIDSSKYNKPQLAFNDAKELDKKAPSWLEMLPCFSESLSELPSNSSQRT